MDPNSIKTMAAAAGAASGDKVYVEDVFSIDLYIGGGYTDKTVNNGIDLDGEGGLVWVKSRDTTYPNHWLLSESLGNIHPLSSNFDTSASYNQSNWFGANPLYTFNNNGFTLAGQDGLTTSGDDYVAWTFRKCPGFFDIVTWTGDGTDPRTISHNLGSVPGCIMVKRTDDSADWIVFHSSNTTGYMKLNSTADNQTRTDYIYVDPTSTTFRVGGSAVVNASSATYVAYLFANNDAQFGADEDESIIKCGTFTAVGNGTVDINTGWEPQYILAKRKDANGSWFLIDTMRGWTADGRCEQLVAEADDEPYTVGSLFILLNSNGFTTSSSGFSMGDYVYIAIRRGPMKTPEAGTDVFKTLQYSGSGGTVTRSTSILVDAIISQRLASNPPYMLDRLRKHGQEYIATNASTNIGEQTTSITEMMNDSLKMGSGAIINGSGNTYNLQLFKRAPGFFDIVGYHGTGSAKTVPHNLGVVPEMMIVKNRDSQDWRVFHTILGGEGSMQLNTAYAAGDWSVFWNDTMPTSSVFTVGSYDGTNESGEEHVAYLFATLPGVSKVGSYTGTGNDIDIDCGFTAGARFVMIKRHDGSGLNVGDWYIWDTVRGIVAGNDSYLLLNSDAAAVTNTDYIDPLNAGFTVTSSAPDALNESGGGYIYLAIA